MSRRLRSKPLPRAPIPPRRVAIVGMYRHEPLPDLEGYEVWTVNDGHFDLDRDGLTVDRCYELHRPADRPWRSADHWEWINENPSKVWTFFPELVKGNAYPIVEVLTRWRAFHTCSFTWMIAHAMLEQVAELRLVRCRLATFHEQIFEKPGVCYWLALAEAADVRVRVSPGSGLLSAPFLYGLQDTADAHAALYESWSWQWPSPSDPDAYWTRLRERR